MIIKLLSLERDNQSSERTPHSAHTALSKIFVRNLDSYSMVNVVGVIVNIVFDSQTTGVGIKKAAPKKAEAVKKEAALNGLANGSAALSKPPPSPPAADNALLPDVIA